MDSIEVSTESVAAAVDFVRQRTVGLFVRDCLDTPVIIGSGVLYASVSGLGILTATHVVHSAMRRRRGLFFAMPISRSGEEPIFISVQGARVELPIVAEPLDQTQSPDVCFVRVSRSDWPKIPKNAYWVIRTEIILAEEPLPQSPVLVFGFPVDLMTLRIRPWYRQSRALAVVTTHYDESSGKWQPELPGLDLDLHFDVPKSGLSLAGHAVGAPTPPGLSGCGIWSIPYDCTAGIPRLVAIQHRWNRVVRALRGTRLVGLYRELAPLHPKDAESS